MPRNAPYKHADGSNCYTRDCKLGNSKTAGARVALNAENLNEALKKADKKLRPIIGLDLDGVTVGYEEGLAQFVMKEKGLSREDLPPLTNYSTVKSGWPVKDEQEFKDLHAKAVDENLYTKLKALPGAVDALNRLANDGYKIRVITSRFVKPGQHAEVVRQTTLSLDKLGVPYHDISFTADKADVKADIYIDDAPYNIDSLREAGKTAIVYGQAYNEGYDNRVTNWEEAEREIRRQAPLPKSRPEN